MKPYLFIAFIPLLVSTWCRAQEKDAHERLEQRLGNRVFIRKEADQTTVQIQTFKEAGKTLEIIDSLPAEDARLITCLVLQDAAPALKLEVLKKCRGLKRLDVCDGARWNTALTKVIADLPQLEEIWAENTGFDGDALRAACKSPKLWVLMIANNPLQAADLSALAKAREMKQLCLADIDLSKCDFQFLKGCPKLSWLHIANTKATDALFVPLQNCPELELLTAVDTHLSQAAVDEFSQKRPKVLVSTGSSGEERVTGQGDRE